MCERERQRIFITGATEDFEQANNADANAHGVWS